MAASPAARRVMRTCVWGQSGVELASSEGDDAANRIVRRNADGHAIPGNHFDAKAAHSAAELGQDLVARIDLHPIQAAAMNGNHGALNINEVILAQICCPFILSSIAGLSPGTYRPRTASSTLRASDG